MKSENDDQASEKFQSCWVEPQYFGRASLFFYYSFVLIKLVVLIVLVRSTGKTLFQYTEELL